MEDRLKKFTIIVDAGSFVGAAKKLHTSQPALTASVKTLERELKTDLLLRSNRGLHMTPAGSLAYEQGKRLLLAQENFLQSLQLQKKQKRLLRLGCIDSIAELAVENRLFDQLEDECELSLTIQNSSVLKNMLQKGELDCTIIVQQPTKPRDYAQKIIGNESFSLVGSRQRIEDFAHTRPQVKQFLAYNQGSTTYSTILTQLEHNKLEPQPTFYSTNPSILLALALQGKGMTALPTASVRQALGQKSLVELKLKHPLRRPVCATWHQARVLPPSIDAFLIALQKAL